jgi:superfamily II DNA or RNA helicase
VVDQLKKCGYTVDYDSNKDYTFQADLSLLTQDDLNDLEDRNDQVDVIGLICDHPDGFMVEAPTGWGKSHIIGQVCTVLPDYKIAVVVPGKDITATVYKRLKKRIRDVGMVGGGSNYIARVTVSTMESVHKLAGVEWDLMIFDEVHRAGGPAIAGKIAEVFYKTKCVGLSASPTGRSDGADLMVEALFGPVIYRVGYNQGVDRGAVVPIEAKVYRINTGPVINSSNGTVINRNCLWRNRKRNQLIAELARALPEDEQVLITVATAEHALYLKKELPEFEVVFSSMSKNVKNAVFKGHLPKVKGVYNGSMMDGRREALRVAFEKGELKKAIATGVWNTGVDFKKLSYLIRADGMASEIASTQTPGRLSRTTDGKEKGILIDFMDEFSPSLRRRSNKRIKAYKDKGWDVQIINTKV